MAKRNYMETPVNWKLIILLGIFSGLANNVIMRLSVAFSIGLYLDTIFTVAAAFLGALVPGIICAVLTTVIFGITYFFITGTPYFWAWYFYILCSIAAVLLIRFFARLFPEECENVRIISRPGNVHSEKPRYGPLFIMLTALSLAMCILMSVVGGLISACITLMGDVVPNDLPPETWFRLGFIRQGFSLLASEILGRIPVNIADRPIAVFGGYGIAILVRIAFRARKAAPAVP